MWKIVRALLYQSAVTV